MEIEENIFYDEVMNKLQALEDALFLAKDGTTDTEVINEIFRSIHTVKGVCDLLGFIDIVTITHKAEDLLDQVRSNKITFTPAIYYVLIELKGFISILVTDALRGKDMNSEKRSMFDSFMKDIISHLAPAVLVFEDDENDINILNGIKNLNFIVLKKPSFDLALEKLKNNNIKIILSNMNNNEDIKTKILQQIKEKYSNISIILALDSLTEHFVKLAKQVHAKAWIKKPFESEKIKILLEKVS